MTKYDACRYRWKLSYSTSQWFHCTQQWNLGEGEVESLRAETNFSPAIALFEAVLCMGRNAQLAFVHHTNLIRSCAYHNSAEGAIHVFEQLERRKDLLPDSRTYRYMLQVFTNAGNFQAAEAMFKAFRQAGMDIFPDRVSVRKFAKLESDD